VAIVFILGIIFGNFISISFTILLSLVCFVGLLSLASFILKKQIISYSTLFLAIFLIASFIYQNSLRLSSNHIANFITQEKKPALVKGLIISDPIYSKTVYGTSKTTFILEANQIKENSHWQITQGKIRTTLYGHPDLFEYGDLLLLEGRLYKPNPPTNPGQFNYKEYLERKHIYALLTANQKNSIHLISQDNGNPIMQYTLKLKHILKNRLYNLLPEQNASLISAMLLGDREDLSDEIMEDFKNSGTMHILAISGLHVGIIVLILLGFLRLLRIPIRIRFILTIFFIVWYALLTGAKPSVIRATIMACILLFGKVIYREGDIYNSLGLACLIILLYNPLQLYAAGFILSFTAVLSIVYLTPKIEKKFSFQNKLSFPIVKGPVKYIVRLLSGSFAVWVGLAPIIWGYFNIISPITIIANIIIIPVTFFILLMSIICSIFPFIWGPLTNLVTLPAHVSTNFLYRMVEIFSSFKFGHVYLPDLDWHNLVIYYIGIIIVSGYKKFHLNRTKIAIFLLILLNLVVWLKITEYRKKSDGKIKITFLDVGDGDSIFIQFPDGKNMLVDTGRAIPFNSGEFIIGPFLWHEGIRTINCLILTHPDSDHIGGAKWIINHFNVRCIMDNGVNTNSKIYSQLKTVIAENEIRRSSLRREDAVMGYDNVKIQVLHPPVYMAKSTETSMNNKSIVLLVSYKEFDFLFCADIMQEAIEDIIRVYNKGIDIEVLKIPHHGRVKPVSVLMLLREYKPEISVVSCSERYIKSKFQNNVTILKKNNNRVYITAYDGAITLTTDGKKLKMRRFTPLELLPTSYLFR